MRQRRAAKARGSAFCPILRTAGGQRYFGTRPLGALDEVEGSLEIGLGTHRVAFGREEITKIDVRADVLGVEGDDRSELGLGAHLVALVREELAEVHARANVLRVEDEGHPETVLGIPRVAFGREDNAYVVKHGDVLRVEGEDSPQLGLGFREVACFKQVVGHGD